MSPQTMRQRFFDVLIRPSISDPVPHSNRKLIDFCSSDHDSA
jgi:hypothetical protein